MSPATEESVSDFGFDCVKALIDDKLEDLLLSQNVNLPPQLSIQDVTAHLHHDVEDAVFLQDMLFSLCSQGINSLYYVEALQVLIDRYLNL